MRDRYWWYPKGQWSGRLPSLGGDEWGRRTLVLPLYFKTLVVALWTCWCDDCCLVRRQTAQWEKEDRLEQQALLHEALDEFHEKMNARIGEAFDNNVKWWELPDTSDLKDETLIKIRSLLN